MTSGSQMMMISTAFPPFAGGTHVAEGDLSSRLAARNGGDQAIASESRDSGIR